MRKSTDILKTMKGVAISLIAAPVMMSAAFASQIEVKADPGAAAQAIDAAVAGDVLILQKGIHEGPLVIDKSLTLKGVDGAVIDGKGVGTVIKVFAENVTVKNLKIINSGDDLPGKDSGIYLHKTAHHAVVENNFLEGNLISIYLWGADDVMVRNNVVHGRQDLRVNERGNGVQLWESDRSQVIGNQIEYGRDGIFVMTSKGNVFRENAMAHTRFAVHYMYANNSVLEANISRNNHVGYALMFSSNMLVKDNTTTGERDHGIALNYANGSMFEGNQVVGVKDKCIFIYNSSKNEFRRNLFQGCGIGVHFTAGSERNALFENAFVANQTQVKYVGTRSLDWAREGLGNYWSDNPAFDLDGDGIADAVYHPNDMVDRVVWAYPMSKLLLNSPAVQMLRWAQSAFPAMRTGGVYDSAPLMRPRIEAAVEKVKVDG